VSYYWVALGEFFKMTPNIDKNFQLMK